jgi:hypothetical protein
MQSIKRDVTVGLSLSAIVFAGALAWGSPFVGASSSSAQTEAQRQQTQPDPTQQAQPGQTQPDLAQGKAQSKTFTGTVVKAGDSYALRDSTGQLFKLDDSERAQPFEGKAVKVTGQLDEQAMVIHVESIEGASA